MSYFAVERRAHWSGPIRALFAPLLAVAFLLTTPAAGLKAAIRTSPVCRMACAGTAWCCCKPPALKRSPATGASHRPGEPSLKAASPFGHCPIGCAAIPMGSGASIAPPGPAAATQAPVLEAGIGHLPQSPGWGLPAPARIIQPRAPPELPDSL